MNSGKKVLMILMLSGLSFNACAQDDGRVVIITNSDLKVALNEHSDIQLIDVRTPAEYDKGKIGNAVNINMLDEAYFDDSVSELDKKRPVYVYCQAGSRSKKAGTKLRQMGFKEVYDLQGGYAQWHEE